MLQKSDRKLKEEGFASIVIALILIVILALLTIGFAQLARREQQNALDKQLANQANYAAESGINDIYQVVQQVAKDPDTTKLTTLSKAAPNTCLSDPSQNAFTSVITGGLPSGTINANTGVAYTCVLMNLTPPDIKYDDVAARSDRYVSFSTTPAPTSFTIHWGSADGKKPRAGGVSSFAPLGSWNYPAVLQVSLTPLNAVDRNSLVNNTLTIYLYPGTNGGMTVNYSSPAAQSSQEGQVFSGNCNPLAPGSSPKYPCQVKISGISSYGTGPYLLHIVDYYDNSNIDVNGQPLAGSTLTFVDGQAQIDVTGQAKNVLKRLQVRVPIHPNAGLPNDAVEGQNVCKEFSTAPPSVNNPNGTTPEPTAGCSLN